MSKKIAVVTLAVVTSVLLSAMFLDAGDQRQAIMSALGKTNYLDCGMDKLNDRERGNLFNLIGGYPIASYTQSAAEAYLQKQGWRQVQVLGAVVVDTVFNEKHVVVLDNYDLYLLDPSMISHLPDPGVYLASSAGSSWKLILPNGEEGNFWAKELK